MFKSLREDIEAVFQRDPAARSRVEVLLCYPGLHALIFHRPAHALWRRGWLATARFVSQIGRFGSGKSRPSTFIGDLLSPTLTIARETNHGQPPCRGCWAPLSAADFTSFRVELRPPSRSGAPLSRPEATWRSPPE